MGAFVALEHSEPGRELIAQTRTYAEARAARPAKDTVGPHVIRLFDLRAIAGKTPAEVEAVLGAPGSRGTADVQGTRYPVHSFRDGHVRVVFVSGKADWITISRLRDVPFSPHALKAFGFGYHEPASNGLQVIQWRNLAGLREISVFPATKNTADYATVFANSDP